MPAPMRTKQPHPIPTRDPALKWLAAESQSFAKQHAKNAAAVRTLREQYVCEISSLREVKAHLDSLKARGVKPKRVLKYLTSFVLLEKRATWQGELDANKANLRELAERLGSIADEVEGEYSADTIRPDLWAMSLGVPCMPAPPYDHRKAVECMRETAADLETKARGFGRLRKDITPVVRREPIVKLLQHVCNPKPSDTPEFPKELRQRLAELLHAVCEKYGIENSFNADSLFQTFKRHVLRPSR